MVTCSPCIQSSNDKVPLLEAIGSHRPVKSILKYASLSMRIEGAWSTTPFTYFPSSGVRERSTWCRYRLPGDGLSTFLGNIRFVRSRGVTSSRIVELRGETYPSPSLRLLVGALSDRLISRDHTSFRST